MTNFRTLTLSLSLTLIFHLGAYAALRPEMQSLRERFQKGSTPQTEDFHLGHTLKCHTFQPTWNGAFQLKLTGLSESTLENVSTKKENKTWIRFLTYSSLLGWSGSHENGTLKIFFRATEEQSLIFEVTSAPKDQEFIKSVGLESETPVEYGECKVQVTQPSWLSSLFSKRSKIKYDLVSK